MTIKNLVKTIGVIGALAVGGNAFAQEYKESMYKRTGDFMLVSDYMHSIDKENTTSIDSIIRGGNVTSYHAIDAIEGLKSRLNFLKTPEAKKFYSIQQISELSARYNCFIKDIKKERRGSNYQHSLETLSQACEDGHISPSEIKLVGDGTYMLVKEGIDKKVGKYSVYALVNIDGTEKIAETPLPSPKEKIPQVGGYPYNERIAQKNDYSPAADEPTAKEKVNPVYSLIVGANTNKDLDYLTGSLGLRVNPFRNEKIGLGFTVDAGLGKDKEIESDHFEFSEGEEYFGEINEVNNSSIGASGELQLYNLILGGGFDYRKNISETNERLIRGEEVLDSSSNSTQEGNFYGKVYAGLEFQPTKRLAIGATVGYHQKDGLQFGTRAIIKLNRRR